MNFAKLITEELSSLRHARPGDSPDARPTIEEYKQESGTNRAEWIETHVSFMPDDLVGLSLSGGGIRSATFNLGLLQGLDENDLLPLVDYLSTVSGGGYVGSWWTAWKSRNDPVIAGFAAAKAGFNALTAIEPVLKDKNVNVSGVEHGSRVRVAKARLQVLFDNDDATLPRAFVTELLTAAANGVAIAAEIANMVLTGFVVPVFMKAQAVVADGAAEHSSEARRTFGISVSAALETIAAGLSHPIQGEDGALLVYAFPAILEPTLLKVILQSKDLLKELRDDSTTLPAELLAIRAVERLARTVDSLVATSKAVNHARKTLGVTSLFRDKAVAANRGASPFANANRIFPASRPSVEAGEIRHLREFSRFLSPRVGFFEMETWNAIVSYLGGLVLSAPIAIGLALLAWMAAIALGWGLADRSPVALVGYCSLITLLHTFVEVRWRSTRSGAPATGCQIAACYAGAILVLCVVFLAIKNVTWCRPALLYDSASVKAIVDANGSQAQPSVSWAAYLPVVTVATGHWREATQLLCFPSVVLLCSAVLFIAWVFAARALLCSCGIQDSPSPQGNYTDRLIGHLLAFGIMSLAAAMIWLAGAVIAEEFMAKTGLTQFAGATMFTWITSNLLFIQLRGWLFRQLRPGKKAGRFDSFKPFVPMLLGYAAVTSGAILIAGVYIVYLRVYKPDFPEWLQGVAIVFVSLVLLVMLLNPQALGLHRFYRRRISRAFGGASNRAGAVDPANRETDESAGDDMYLSELTHRPLHLVCCTANALADDSLKTLSRGARSCAVSAHGVSIGNRFMETSQFGVNPTYGDFLAASAAAFNSCMGSVSKELGPAVSLLLSAANLRLGLWVANPQSGQPSIIPGFCRRLYDRLSHGPKQGLLFLCEMFGQARTGGAAAFVHLSDGGHFENLGLYELIRRRCTYIIVSDCGADPNYEFADLGNAVRRIREDFGCEIEIDLTALHPDEHGVSKQHVAVGTIHYEGFDNIEKGMLIFLKPNLTGDEPVDIQQYHRQNARFPNDNTADQFFDEAQWEAYRMLGKHSAEAAFAFLRRPSHEPLVNRIPQPADIFPWMRWEWYPSPPTLADNVVSQAKDLEGVISALGEDSSHSLRSNIFQDFIAVVAPTGGEIGKEAGKVLLLLRMIQRMENTLLSCKLDSLARHPLNLGWINLFQKWSDVDVFKRWWPLLKGHFSAYLVEFVESTLGLAQGRQALPTGWRRHLRIVKRRSNDEYRPLFEKFTGKLTTVTHWIGYSIEPPPLAANAAVTSGRHANNPPGPSLPVCLIGVNYDPTLGRLKWEQEHFVVRDGLSQLGYATDCLQGLLHAVFPSSDREPPDFKYYSNESVRKAFSGVREVHVLFPTGSRNPQQLRDLIDDVTFYRIFSFRFRSATGKSKPRVRVLALTPDN